MFNEMISIAAAATPAAGANNSSGSPLALLVPILIFGVMIFWLFRSQKKAERKRLEMVDAIKVGDKVISAGGMFGTIAAVKEKSFILKIADNVKIEITKSGVVTIVDKDETAAETAPVIENK